MACFPSRCGFSVSDGGRWVARSEFSSDNTFQFCAGYPVIAQGVDIVALGFQFLRLGEEELVGAELHCVVFEQGFVHDFDAGGQHIVMIKFCHVAQADKPVTQFSCFRTNFHRETGEPVFRAPQSASPLVQPGLSLVENRNL